MELGLHAIKGDITGNPFQPPGKHRALATPEGIGLIPLGDRNRDRHEYGIDYEEERDSLDKYTKYFNKKSA